MVRRLLTVLLLEWLTERRELEACGRAARAISDAVDAALTDPATRTADLGGSLGTRAFGETVARAVAGG